MSVKHLFYQITIWKHYNKFKKYYILDVDLKTTPKQQIATYGLQTESICYSG